MRKFLKGAVVLFTELAIIFSTIAVPVDTIDEAQISKANIKSTNQVQSKPIVQTQLGPVMFLQPVPEENDPWAFYSSDIYLDWLCMDNFLDLPDEISDIHQWCLCLLQDDGWYDCNPNGMMFEIKIYNQNQNPACTYTNLTPTAIPTGKFFLGFEIQKWEVDLYPCCGMETEWISIQSFWSPNGCSFFWANSLTGNLNAEQNGV